MCDSSSSRIELKLAFRTRNGWLLTLIALPLLWVPWWQGSHQSDFWSLLCLWNTILSTAHKICYWIESLLYDLSPSFNANRDRHALTHMHNGRCWSKWYGYYFNFRIILVDCMIGAKKSQKQWSNSLDFSLTKWWYNCLRYGAHLHLYCHDDAVIFWKYFIFHNSVILDRMKLYFQTGSSSWSVILKLWKLSLILSAFAWWVAPDPVVWGSYFHSPRSSMLIAISFFDK